MTKLYNEIFDAYYNADTDTWLEPKCDDPHCYYCISRPPTPSEAECWEEE